MFNYGLNIRLFNWLSEFLKMKGQLKMCAWGNAQINQEMIEIIILTASFY